MNQSYVNEEIHPNIIYTRKKQKKAETFVQ